MTSYLKVHLTLAVPNDAMNEINWSLELAKDELEQVGILVCDMDIAPMTLVSTEWLQQSMEDADDDDGSFDWRPSAPSIGVTANPPQPLDLTGIDPDSPEADDIREAMVEARTPDPDQPW